MIAGYTLVKVSDIEAIDRKIKDATNEIRKNLLLRDLQALKQYKENITEIYDALKSGVPAGTVIMQLDDVLNRTDESIAVVETKLLLEK